MRADAVRSSRLAVEEEGEMNKLAKSFTKLVCLASKSVSVLSYDLSNIQNKFPLPPAHS